MEEKITLDKKTLKALIVDSRLDILKLLNSKKYTQSDLSDILNLSKPTIKEHLDILEDALLIKKEETDRKWKYYSITFKGKRIVDPKEVNVMFAFVLNLVAFIGVGLFSLFKFVLLKPVEIAYPMMAKAAPTMMIAEDDVIEVTNQVSRIIPPWFYYVLILIILLILGSFMLGYILKRRTVVIRK